VSSVSVVPLLIFSYFHHNLAPFSSHSFAKCSVLIGPFTSAFLLHFGAFLSHQ
jgi:hypothetical protein